MNALHREIAALIAGDGPMSFERYMALALGHPHHGYYTTRRPIGAAGDFVTAPEISQMFGELLGLWSAEVWRLMSAPARVNLVELGPGRGTAMADMLRAARKVPAYAHALAVHLVDFSETQRALQRETLAGCDVPITWHAAIDTLPEGPSIIIANEFFDALPVRHYVYDAMAWHERLVGLDPGGALRFGLARFPEPALGTAGRPGAIIEVGTIARDLMGRLADRLVAAGGVLLLIDYGHAGTQFGETVQAVRQHRFSDLLADPGEADLTAHVDFAALAQVGRAHGAEVCGPVEQGAWLRRLGIVERAAMLKRRADPAQQAAIDAALARLVGAGPVRGEAASMASLFKVMAVRAAFLPPLPGFDA